MADPAVSRLSARNPQVQRARRLARQRRTRAEERAFVIEGPHAVAAALDAGAAFEAIFVEPTADRSLVQRARSEAGARVHELEPGTLARISDAVTPQPVLAVAPWCDRSLGDVLTSAGAVRDEAGGGLLLVLHDLRDPGNVGTLLRTAEASGAAGVVVSGHATDVFGPKCVRASAGALFHVPVAIVDGAADPWPAIRASRWRLVGTAADADAAYDQADLTGAVALVLGAESSGLPDDVRARLDELVAIPIEGRAESLNVAAAGAVLCFEASRQRRSLGGV